MRTADSRDLTPYFRVVFFRKGRKPEEKAAEGFEMVRGREALRHEDFPTVPGGRWSCGPWEVDVLDRSRNISSPVTWDFPRRDTITKEIFALAMSRISSAEGQTLDHSNMVVHLEMILPHAVIYVL